MVIKNDASVESFRRFLSRKTDKCLFWMDSHSKGLTKIQQSALTKELQERGLGNT